VDQGLGLVAAPAPAPARARAPVAARAPAPARARAPVAARAPAPAPAPARARDPVAARAPAPAPALARARDPAAARALALARARALVRGCRSQRAVQWKLAATNAEPPRPLPGYASCQIALPLTSCYTCYYHLRRGVLVQPPVSIDAEDGVHMVVRKAAVLGSLALLGRSRLLHRVRPLPIPVSGRMRRLRDSGRCAVALVIPCLKREVAACWVRRCMTPSHAPRLLIAACPSGLRPRYSTHMPASCMARARSAAHATLHRDACRRMRGGCRLTMHSVPVAPGSDRPI
jgi:hypothetical protein